MYKFIPKDLLTLWRTNQVSEPRDVIQIGIELIQCVANIHSTGFLHNDIKLDNIMIDEDNKVFLIDYGNASKFNLPDGTHRPNLPVDQYGNPYFCSKNVHLK